MRNSSCLEREWRRCGRKHAETATLRFLCLFIKHTKAVKEFPTLMFLIVLVLVKRFSCKTYTWFCFFFCKFCPLTNFLSDILLRSSNFEVVSRWSVFDFLYSFANFVVGRSKIIVHFCRTFIRTLPRHGIRTIFKTFRRYSSDIQSDHTCSSFL